MRGRFAAGVSNFDVADMEDLIDLGVGQEVSTNQVLYNLVYRGIEFDLLPRCERRGIPVMAYSPIKQGQLLSHPVLKSVARRHHVSPSQAALAWVLRRDKVCAIPRAGKPAHVHENRAALDVRL